MSQSILYGFTANELKPGPDFSAGPDGSGKYTGSQTFTCRKFDFTGATIQQKIRRGTPITDVYPDLGGEWNFLIISNARHEHQSGGITKVFIEYEGLAADSFEWGEDGLEVSYALNATLTDKSIMSHPDFIGNLTWQEQNAIPALIDGTGRRAAYENEGDLIRVISNHNGRFIGNIYTPEGLEWYNKIIIQKQTTYQVSAVEWTKTSNSKKGIVDEDLNSLGYIDTPEGEPPTFAGRNWRLTAASQNSAKSGDTTIKTWTKTWTLSPQGEAWDPVLYTKPA